ncbi:hypothetical protein [Xanthomonas phage AhaSv]|nr:hypothetical protein [Xanthomonas phage AhaSv]
MATCTIKFRDGQTMTFNHYKHCERSEGWIAVTDEYGKTHSFPADTIMCVEETPARRW